MVGGLAFLAGGSEAALGRSLFLRPAAFQEDPPSELTRPTTLTASHTVSYTFEGGGGTDTWTQTLTHSGNGTWSYTELRESFTVTYANHQTGGTRPNTWTYSGWVTWTQSITPPATRTYLFSGNGGTATVTWTNSLMPSNTHYNTFSLTGSWTTTTPGYQRFVKELEMVEAEVSQDVVPEVGCLDWEHDLEDVLSRFGAPMELRFRQ